MNNFWLNLPKPFTVLAPMEDVTDTVFRRIVAECGRPDVFFTEFTSCEGMQSVGQTKVIHRLKYDLSEKPIVAQVWGITPEDYFKTANLILELGFDGLDINMGCPVKKIVKQGACSGLIKNPTLAKEIVLAVKEALQGQIPLSIKTRIGFNQIDTENWCGFLLQECRPDVLTIHGRTVKEESKVANHWDEIGKVVKMRDDLYEVKKPLIIGNGDIQNLKEAREKAEKYDLDGIMVGRGIFRNPWLFSGIIDFNESGELIKIQTGKKVTSKEKLDLLLRHLNLFEETWGQNKNFAILKRFFKIYCSGFEGAGDLRVKLMECESYDEVRSMVGI